MAYASGSLDRKYSNLFWHEGVKIFEERMAQSEAGRTRIAHLENDVTKSLLNVFEHCDDKVLGSVLTMLGVRDAPGTFSLDFQVTDTNAYRTRPRRIMLSIIAAATPITSDPHYNVTTSRPDGCISNDRTAILIEVKTQSPLVTEQIESHIHHYLGSATELRTLTWEDISERFRMLIAGGKLAPLDSFLLSHFIELLDMLGIDAFNGFNESDFAMLDTVGRVPAEDFRDAKRHFRRKLEKFASQVFASVQDAFSFRPFSYRIEQGETLKPSAWTAFYLHDGDTHTHVNAYPNISLMFTPTGLDITINAEIAQSFKRVMQRIGSDPGECDRQLAAVTEMSVGLASKVQYQPMDHFVIRPVYGFPVAARDTSAEAIRSAVDRLSADWSNYVHTTLHEMTTGSLLHETRRPFTESEIAFARRNAVNPNFVFSLGMRYTAAQIATQGGKITAMIARDIRCLAPFLTFIVGHP